MQSQRAAAHVAAEQVRRSLAAESAADDMEFDSPVVDTGFDDMGDMGAAGLNEHVAASPESVGDCKVTNICELHC